VPRFAKLTWASHKVRSKAKGVDGKPRAKGVDAKPTAKGVKVRFKTNDGHSERSEESQQTLILPYR